jgi:signal peptidase I
MARNMAEFGAVLGTLLRFGGISYCLTQAADIIMCIGPSMLPTLNRNGDIVLLDKISPHFRKLTKGEIVIAKSVSNPRHTVCKRVIAEVKMYYVYKIVELLFIMP